MIFLVIGLFCLGIIAVIVYVEMYIVEGRGRNITHHKGVLCYLVRDTDKGFELCLARKEPTKGALKRGLAGKRNGYGGGLETTDSSYITCALRELYEESLVVATLEEITEIGRVRFHNGIESVYECVYFIVRVPHSKPLSTEEMSDPVWFPSAKLPYDDMMPSDRIIMPLILAHKRFEADVYYDREKKILGHKITVL